MRLRTRYVSFGVGCVVILCCVELYVFMGRSTHFTQLTHIQEKNGEDFVDDYDLIHNRKHKTIAVRSASAKGEKPDAVVTSNNKHPQGKEILRLRPPVPVTISADEFRRSPDLLCGNPLIDEYGQNDLTKIGESGRGVTFVGEEKKNATLIFETYHLNVMASDLIPLNRMVPDSRLPGCSKKTYAHDLQTTSVIMPFFDEWPSVLVRTLYSLVNRTPRHLLKEIILIDDGSTMSELKKPLDDYIEANFPRGLVKIKHNAEREGLIKARLAGWKRSTGEVVVFFDSHMEVNIDWLQPLLTEIKKNRKTVAMSVLDYINSETFEYRFNEGYLTRYGFDWRMVFFETFFRPDQIGPEDNSPRPGTVMVGAAYAIDSKYFEEIGTYDEGMIVWGGENLEMAWRVWMCGGSLTHLPCSHLGHIARSQPYSFPGGRRHIELHNYKRAVEVWMEPRHKNFIYDHFPDMINLDVGDMSERLKLKEKLQCENFTWFLNNIWPELAVFDYETFAWGAVQNLQDGRCLDNHQYLFQAPEMLYADPCHYKLASQGFSWTINKLIKSSLQCIVIKTHAPGTRPVLEDCIIGPKDTWAHVKNGMIKHEGSGLCLDMDPTGPVMQYCNEESPSQKWQFRTYLM